MGSLLSLSIHVSPYRQPIVPVISGWPSDGDQHRREACRELFIYRIFAVFSSVSEALLCLDLDENGDLFEQMKTCSGETFRFKTSSTKNPVFDLSKLDQTTADKILYEDVKGNPDPTLPKKFTGYPQKVEVVGNKKLKSFDLRPGKKLTLILKGNKELSMQSINNIDEINKVDQGTSKIQEFQECSFNGKSLGNLADLQGCKRIYGDLIINQNTKIPDRAPTLRIKKIENGCVKIENSALKDSHFLDDLFKDQMKCTAGKHVIKNNKDLCLSSEQREKWIAAGFELVYTGTCDDRCTVDYAMKNKDAAKSPCDIVVGDVKITGDHRRRRQSGTPPQLAHWDRVKKLEGTLEVSGTNLENITIFNNLEKIANPSPEKVALTVIKNPKMTKFDLPKLENITMPPNTWSEPIYFQDNENFTFTFPEGKRWERITEQSHLLIPVEPEPVTIPPPTTPGTTTLSPAEMRNKQTIEDNAAVKTNEKLMIGGVCAGGCLLVAVGTFLCYRCCCKKNKKGKLTKDDNDLFTHLMPVIKKAMTLIKKKEDKKEADKKEEKSDVTLARGEQPDEFILDDKANMLIEMYSTSVENRQETARTQMALHAEEIPFKMTDVIMKMDASELDLPKARNLLTQAPLPKMKYTGKPFRHMEEYKILFFNPKKLNREPVPYMEKYDRIAMFKYFLTHCSEVFVVNFHLMPDIIADCSGPYYTPNNSLLAEIEGPVYVIGDIHEALHVVQTVLNLDLDGDGKKHKIHPMFRNRYLFLGDYLDRGEHGLEVYFLLCIAARLFPELFTVLRGNHDGDIAAPNAGGSRMNAYGDRLLADQEKVANPYHFADCMIIDLVTKITPFLPMAAIINGHTFASHGGFTLGMATTKKSIRQIFQEVPVPYYDEFVYKVLLGQRYTSHSDPKKFPQKYKVAKEDAYTARLTPLTVKINDWYIKAKKYIEDKEVKKLPRNPDYESRFPGLNSIMWSDPGHGLASAGSRRGCGCTYNIELVQKMMENNKATKNTKSIVDIIRAHQVVGFAHACDHRVTTVFTNCNNVQKTLDTLEQLKCPTKYALLNCSTILRINEDGTRTIILLAMTTKKPADMALVNPDRKIKREFVVEKELKVDPKIKKEKQSESPSEKSVRVRKSASQQSSGEKGKKTSQRNNST